MKTLELLDYLRDRDVRLWADGARLQCSAPAGVLTAALQSELRERKTEILAALAQLQRHGRADALPIARARRDGDLPLSFAQERLWFLEQLQANAAYNVPVAFRLAGSLDLRAFEWAVAEIIRRHEVLRTTFHAVAGRPVQRVSPPSRWHLAMLDLQALPSHRREAEVERLFAHEEERPFDLTCGPLLRVKLLRLAPQEHVLLLTTHHIIFDAWSFPVFFHELSVLYEAFGTADGVPLPGLPIQYADFAVWQRQLLVGTPLHSQWAYWQQQLAGELRALDLPTSRPRPPVQTYRGAEASVVLPASLTEAIRALAQREQSTLFMTLLAAFTTLLYRYTGEEDVLVGSPLGNRPSTDTERLIGFFGNTLVLRGDLSGNPTFRATLRRVREVALEAYAHQDLPFEHLVQSLQPERDLSRTPLFQVMFSLQDASPRAPTLRGLIVRRLHTDTRTAKFDLTLSVTETAAGLNARLEYNTDLFERATIVRMLAHFETLLAGIVADPDSRLADLPLLTTAETRQLLVDWNRTAADYPRDACVHGLFEAQVARTPDAVALVWGDEQVTYGELNRRANRLAHHLRGLGVGPEVLVGLCLERAVAPVVGMLAILKAGGAYLPLDAEYPPDRLAFMLEDTQTQVVVTQQRLVGRLGRYAGRVVCLDGDWQPDAPAHADNPTSQVCPDNLAYVIYTSGSTGWPKGAAIEHRSAVALFAWAQQTFSVADLAGVLASTSICFDLSVYELLFTLTQGGTAVLAEDVLQLGSLAERDRLTLINTVPSAMAELVQLRAVPASVRTINMAGEALRRALAQELYAHSGVQRVYNLYGPSETTTYSTFALVEAEAPNEPPIGRPIHNTQLFVLDRYFQPVPVGVRGELHVAGAGVARGYLNRPALTAGQFLPNPWGDAPGARCYRTGDLVRYTPHGDLEYLGRIDAQLKLRGFRIEPGEIEVVLAEHSAVREAAVVVREDAPGDRRLVAYVVTCEPIPTALLRAFVADRLPCYMVPATLIFLDALPRTTNGKVDRPALPAPDSSPPGLEPAVGGQRTAMEEQLAALWAELLGLEQLGLHDNFFDLGGHSLLATQVISRIRDDFGVKLPLRSVFESPTVAELVDRVAAAH